MAFSLFIMLVRFRPAVIGETILPNYFADFVDVFV